MSKHHFSPRPVPKAALIPDPPADVTSAVTTGDGVVAAPFVAEAPTAPIVFREAIDLRLVDGAWQVVVVAYGGGGYAERVIFSSLAGAEAVARFVAATKKKCLPALGLNLGADAERL